MKAGITGDFKALRQFAKDVAKLAKAPATVATTVSETSLAAEIASEFASNVDPFGAQHAPRKDGGQAYASVGGAPAKVRSRGLSIVVSVTRRKLRFMNRGRRVSARGGYMPPRPIVPDPSSAVPPKWEAVVTKAAEQVMRDKAVR